MPDVLKGLHDSKVFEYFEAISEIPRGSGNEKAISDYMVQFAKDLNLEVKQDEAYNIYIKKPATPGYENAPAVILQGHLDMVCEKNKETTHDFEKDGLNLYIDEDWIGAKGTTLGADNGVAIAYQMALLADNSIKHPALECLMTTDEERGMTGVAHLHPEYLSGKVLLNLDTDNEGEFLVSCAGGAKAYFTLPVAREAINASGIRITINGLKGGHSGADIHFERANAHILMGRVLDAIRNKEMIQIAELKGGSKDNVITRECECVIVANEQVLQDLTQLITAQVQIFNAEYRVQEADIKVVIEQNVSIDKVLTRDASNKVIDFLLCVPNGVLGYDQDMKGLVQTSLNLGILQLEADHLVAASAVRSSVATRKEEVLSKLKALSHQMGITFEVKGDYPAWQYNANSRIREMAGELYSKMYGQEASFTAIHAGLECGFISEKLPGLDMISFGPNVRHIHSPEEVASISSMSRVYEYVVKLLENLVSY